MQYGDFKISVHNYDLKMIKVKSEMYKIDLVCDFASFKDFAKYIYGTYKKYDYVLKRGEKNGIKNNTS